MNASTGFDLPPLPSYTLHELPPLIPGIPDKVLQLLAPIIAYWLMSGFFHFIDTYDIWPQYRLHTPLELLQRNHVGRIEAVKNVLLQQVGELVFGLYIAWNDPVETYGNEDYNVAIWAQRLRMLQSSIPKALGLIGVDSISLGHSISKAHPLLAGPLLGGQYPDLLQTITTAGAVSYVPAFTTWELWAGKIIFYAGIPAIRFFAGIVWVDTWQYMLHRGMHMNKFLYTWLHSRHHRLYVPYAYGALYQHPFEGFLLDTLGTGLAFLGTGMTIRQGMCLYVISLLKTVDDHSGYALPWDPFQWLFSNNAAYHDIHHQSWGIKTNFAQPWFTFWDRILSTSWKGGDVKARYSRAKLASQKKYESDIVAGKNAGLEAVPIPGNEDPARNSEDTFDFTNNTPSDEQASLAERARQEKIQETEMRQRVARATRRKTSSISGRSGESLRGITDRVVGSGSSPHSGRATILHAEQGH